MLREWVSPWSGPAATRVRSDSDIALKKKSLVGFAKSQIRDLEYPTCMRARGEDFRTWRVSRYPRRLCGGRCLGSQPTPHIGPDVMPRRRASDNNHQNERAYLSANGRISLPNAS